MTSVDYIVCCIGSGAVGKSSITIRFCYNRFSGSYDPTLEDSYKGQITVDNTKYFLNIIDTAGQEEYAGVRDCNMRDGTGFILVYSIIDEKSFEEVATLHEQIYRTLDFEPEEQNVPIVLVANKSDLESDRQVPKECGEDLAKKWGVPYLEVSAKENINIRRIFETVVKEMKKKPIISVTTQNAAAAQKATKGKHKKGKKCVVV
ncbi:hypothetical protein EIN_251120 [Entamoeba invadens IP1]|uniref:Uncharacterized protein n=1 Tax=Entamoeba invadens IP1 TaxID=370355 RepID=A0A0A1UEQ5_ENTIV|nr:hypothetical protein EIN_251120 [Entamoeba invadens IP1]ELP94968.1 hypothetical protein EIN_251120 [Entamoeba invadens IP1]|eukprot:XP_004261739.1 hypothetical protein EIN_251120 [Entamoeba invadens IP1]